MLLKINVGIICSKDLEHDKRCINVRIQKLVLLNETNRFSHIGTQHFAIPLNNNFCSLYKRFDDIFKPIYTM